MSEPEQTKTRTGITSEGQPQLYSVKREEGRFIMSRREFMAASVAAVVVGLHQYEIGCGAELSSQVPSSGLVPIVTGQDILRIRAHGKAIRCLAFSPDGNYLASGSDDDTIKLWSLLNDNLDRKLSEHTGNIYTVAVTPDGWYLVSGSDDDTVKLRPLFAVDQVETLGLHTGDVNSVTLSPDGEYLVTASSDGTIRLWFIPNRELLQTVDEHVGEVSAVAFAPGGNILASGGADHTIRLWSFSNGVLECRCVVSEKGKDEDSEEANRRVFGAISTLTFLGTDTYFASAGDGGKILLWRILSLEDCQVECERVLDNHSGDVNSLAYIPQSDLLVSAGDDRTIRLWSLADGQKTRKLVGHTDDVTCVAVSSDGSMLASADEDGHLILWILDGSDESWLFFHEAACVNASVILYRHRTAHITMGLCSCNLVCTCDTVMRLSLPPGTSCTCNTVSLGPNTRGGPRPCTDQESID